MPHTLPFLFSKEFLLSGMMYATLLFSQCIFGLSKIVFLNKKTPPAPVTLVCGCFTFQCLPCSHQRSQYMVNGNQSLPTSSPATSERHLLTEQHIHISYPILNPAGHYRLDAITGSIPTASSHICKPTGNLEAQKHGWKRLYGMCV